jgi:hypothetical protein
LCQCSALDIECDVVVFGVDLSPVSIASGVAVAELVAVGTVTKVPRRGDRV